MDRRAWHGLEERANVGLHAFLASAVIPLMPRGRAVDLGAGSGSLTLRLRDAGFDVIAVDLRPPAVEIDSVIADLNGPFANVLHGRFDLVTAVEVIEHLENPIAFLRAIADLLAPQGMAVITTPNVDSLPARVKFLLKGTIRMLDSYGDPTHITPVFWDLLTRQYLPRAGLTLHQHLLFPSVGHKVGRPAYTRVLRLVSPLLRGETLQGDNHVLVLRRTDAS